MARWGQELARRRAGLGAALGVQPAAAGLEQRVAKPLEALILGGAGRLALTAHAMRVRTPAPRLDGAAATNAAAVSSKAV